MSWIADVQWGNASVVPGAQNVNIAAIHISQTMKHIFYWYYIVMIAVTILLTLLSGVVYLVKNWNLLKGY